MVQPEYLQRSVECKEIVEQALASLTPAQRRVIELLHFEGRTLQEISQLEGKELTGIRNSYYRGVNALRMSFGKGVGATVIRATGVEKRRGKYENELFLVATARKTLRKCGAGRGWGTQGGCTGGALSPSFRRFYASRRSL